MTSGLTPRSWLITGVAGFIGSSLLEELLSRNQMVTGLDNFATGHRSNLEDVRRRVGPEAWQGFTFIEGATTDPEAVARACEGVDVVLHQAAVGSVPRSIKFPLKSQFANEVGFVTLLEAAKNAGVIRVVYASSSSVYGDSPELPKVESRIGSPLSPYAAGKRANELYASVFGSCYGLECIGLRYFNVFGARQDPNGAYAAVIPRWVDAMITDGVVRINGDGLTSRDFCYVSNVVSMNLLAATTERKEATGKVYNVGVGGQTTLNDLFGLLRDNLSDHDISYTREPEHDGFRPGDVQHSLANVDRAKQLLGYDPKYSLEEGLKISVDWFVKNAQSKS
ncbi:MAG: UDP-N-acetylglucosamine 4-epimerase [Rhodothermales bacterium]|jgi:UDP-N-acetylglucosamine 4-epimerase